MNPNKTDRADRKPPMYERKSRRRKGAPRARKSERTYDEEKGISGDT